MLVRDIMKTDVRTVPAGATWRQVAELLIHHRVSGAPVVDASGVVVGVVSEKDVFRAIYPSYEEWYRRPHDHSDFLELEAEAQHAQTKHVEDFMSRKLVSVTSDTPVLKIGALMMSTGIHRVPVVDAGKLVGMVSRRDIFRAILRVHFSIWEGAEGLQEKHADAKRRATAN